MYINLLHPPTGLLHKGLLLALALLAGCSSPKVITNNANGLVFSTKGRICWSERKLQWDDFKGDPDIYNSAVASTDHSIYRHYEYRDTNEIRLLISVWFNTNQSWAKNTAINSTSTLRHEQLHLDIDELCARSLRKELLDTLITMSNYQTLIPGLFAASYAQTRDRQIAYDGLTAHGLNKAMQKNWETMIEKEMEGLSAYTDTMMLVRLR